MTYKWITPFKKQCFVVIGASMNMSQVGMVMGFAAILLPQLRADSDISIDEASGSWIAALPGFTLIIGNLTIPSIMAKFGRKKASIVSILIATTGWTCITFAGNFSWILTARALQGISVGMSSCLTPIMIGEYTSPKNRGAFSIIMSLIMATGTLTVHTFGSYVSWRITAFTIAVITLVDLAIVVTSPESPSWLAEKGKHEECKRVFQWLRGDENDELDKLIQANMTKPSRKSKHTVQSYIATVGKKEFYKPIVIMAHLFTMGQWGGINILAAYILDVSTIVMGTHKNMALLVIIVDIQRVFSCVLAVIIIRRCKRRTMLFTVCGLNVLVFLVTAAYVHVKDMGIITGKLNIAGVVLMHLLMMTVAIGSLPIPYTIAGEIFALKYRSLSSGISSAVCSINIFLSVKTFPYLCSKIGLDGAYLLYAGIMLYCLIVVWFLLPETKDRTLQEIEYDFKGQTIEDSKSPEQFRLEAVDEIVE